MTRNSPEFKDSGMTLIEVMIAMALLSFLSIAVYQATVRAFDINSKLGIESTDYTTIALSLAAIETDLSQIYTPLITSEKKPDNLLNNPGTFWGEPIRPDGMRRTRFKGDKEKISFVNSGNKRVEQDSPQSDFQKISWEIERNASGAYSLYRSVDTDAFRYEDRTTKKPQKVPLLENLASAKFSFYRKINKTWEDQWDTEGAFVKPESRYPDLISLKIEVPDPTNNANQQKWEIIVKPNLPLNIEDEKTKEMNRNRLDP